jgi:hypothetical protein
VNGLAAVEVVELFAAGLGAATLVEPLGLGVAVFSAPVVAALVVGEGAAVGEGTSELVGSGVEASSCSGSGDSSPCGVAEADCVGVGCVSSVGTA